MPPGTWLASASSCDGQERSEERQKRQPARRQQDVQDRASQHPIEYRDRELRDGNRRRRQAQFETPDPDRREANERGRDIPQAGEHQYPSNGRDERGRGQPQLDRQAARGKTQSAEQQKAEPEGDHVREDDPRELVRRQPPSRVEPIPHGRTGQHAEADVVRDGIGDKRCHGHATPRQAPPQIGEGQEVVAGQDGVVDGRKDRGRTEA